MIYEFISIRYFQFLEWSLRNTKSVHYYGQLWNFKFVHAQKDSGSRFVFICGDASPPSYHMRVALTPFYLDGAMLDKSYFHLAQKT